MCSTRFGWAQNVASVPNTVRKCVQNCTEVSQIAVDIRHIQKMAEDGNGVLKTNLKDRTTHLLVLRDVCVQHVSGVSNTLRVCTTQEGERERARARESAPHIGGAASGADKRRDHQELCVHHPHNVLVVETLDKRHHELAVDLGFRVRGSGLRV